MKIAKLGIHLAAVVMMLALTLANVAPAMAQPVTSPLSGNIVLNGSPAPDGTQARVLVGSETTPRQTGAAATFTKNGIRGHYEILLVGDHSDLNKALIFQVSDGTNWLTASTNPGNPKFAGAGGYNPQAFDLTAPGAKYTIQTLAAGSIAATTATLNGRLGGDLEGKTVQLRFQYGKTSAYGAETSPQTRSSIGDFSANITSLEPGALYHFRALGIVTLATGQVTIYGSDLTFTTLTQPPSVTTDAESDVSADGATLNGTLTGMGGAAGVNVSFEWGPTAQYGFHTIPQAMTQTGEFEFELKGLAPGKLYHFRAKATSTAGTSNGSDRSFTTLTTAPTVTTVSAANISGNSATLNGFLDSLGGAASAEVWFEYGKTSGDLDKTTAAQTKNARGPFNATVTGLNASAKYYFRAVTQNTSGTAEGVERSFTTSTVLTGIEVTPPDPSIALGEKQQFEAEGTYSDGNKKDLPNILVVWSTDSSNIATINTTGMATSVGTGTTTITASYGVINGTTTLTVTEAELIGLTISPANPSVAAGNTQQFTAIARFSDGTTQVVTGDCDWESLTPAVAEVQVTPGLVEAKALGQATIRATYNSTTAETIFKVTAATLRSVQIDDTYPAVDGTVSPVTVGGNLQLSLTGTKSDGSTVNLTSAATGTVWVSLNPAIAIVSKDGRVTGMTAGTATIKATNKGESDDISIIVTKPPVVTAGGATEIDVDKATLHGFLVNRGTAASVEISFEYGITSGSLDQFTDPLTKISSGPFTADLADLAEDTIYFFRVKAVGDGTSYSPELRFKTAIDTDPPQVDTGNAAGDTFTSDVTTTSAKLYGNLSYFGTAGAGNVAISFEWGLTAAYGNETIPQVMNDTVDFTADLGGLTPKTTYHFRAKAVGDGTAYGDDKEFTTGTVSPAVITNPATRVKPDSAILNGRLDNPGTAASVSVSFEWGLTVAYGNSTPAQTVAKRGDFEALISGLDPSQTYHFRAKAVGDGNSFGADRTFTTDTILTGITVTPNPATIAAGQNQQFTAKGAYSDGRTDVDITGVKWSSSNSAGASINNNGLAKGQSIGNVTITATLAGVDGTASLTINPATVTGIAVNPKNASVDVEATTRFRATATYSDNTKKDVTDTAEWTSSAPTKASVTAGVATGLIADGTNIIITASLSGFSDTANLKVVATEAILQSIDVTPNNPAAISAGETLQFTATGTYQNPDGSTSTADVTRKATWSSSDTAIARVSGNGSARSYAQGSAVITAAIDNISGSETLNVNAPALASITVTPERPSITYVAGGTTTQQFTATGVYTDNSTEDLTGTVTWDRLTPATASINDTGLATAAAVAARSTTRITAIQGGKTGEAILTVLPDKVAPVVTLTSPTEGLVLKDKTLTVSGTTSDPNAATVVIVNGGTPAALTVAGDGSFSQGVSLKAGNNSILVKSTDGAGNTGKAGPINVIVDARRPTVTIMEPADGLMTNTASIIVNGIVSGAASVTLNVNGTPVPVTVGGGRFSQTVTILEGTNKITASAYADGHPNDPDYLGTSGTRTVTLDTKAPIVTIISPISGISVGTAGIEVTGSIDDPTVSTALLIINGGVPRMIEVADGTFSQKITLRSGSNTIVVVATDSVGNSGSSGAPVVVTFDNTRPSVTITEPINKLLTNIAAQTVTGTVDDQTITSATLRWNGTDYPVDVAPDGTFSKEILLSTLAQGINTLKASVTDPAGNIGTSGEITVTLDVTSPVLTIGLSDPTDSVSIIVESDESLNAAPTVSVSGTDIPMSRVRSRAGELRWTGSYTLPGAGDYTVTATGQDKAGNSGTATSTFTKETITVDGVNPTTVETENTSLQIETNGEVQNTDITVTQHMENPSGDNVANPTGNDRAAGAYVEVNASSELRDNLAQVLIKVYYNEAEIDDMLIEESSLRLYLWNTEQGMWQVVGDVTGDGLANAADVAAGDLNDDGIPDGDINGDGQPDSGCEEEDNYLWGWTNHFSQYGVFGSAVVTPTPPTPPSDNGTVTPPPSGSGTITPPSSGGGGGGGGGGASGGTTTTTPPAHTTNPVASNTGTVSLSTVINASGVLQASATVTSADTKATVVVSQGIKALDRSGNALSAITCQPPAAAAPAPSDKNLIAVYDLGPAGATFSSPITVTLKYDPAAIPQGVLESSLVLAWYNVTTGAWEILSNIVVNTVSHTVSGKTTHFTQFAVISPKVAPPAPVIKYNLVATVDPLGSGTVTISPEQPADGYDAGTAVSLTAQASEGYTFDRWSEDISGAQQTVELVINSSKTVTAHFRAIEAPPLAVRYTLTINIEPAGSGTVTLIPAQPADGYDAGTAVSLTAKASNGYAFDRWSGDISGTAKTATLTMDANKSVTARFIKVTPLDTVAPSVLSATPADGAEDVPVDTRISVAFSEPMDKVSVEEAFTIIPQVKGAFSWEGNTLVFTPEKKLKSGNTYAVVISTSAKDASGNALNAVYKFTLTTESGPDTFGLLAGLFAAGAAVAAIVIFLVVRRKSRRQESQT